MPDMNIAAVLKSEIVRLARKELRNETQVLKKALSHHRSEIAALKRRVHELEAQLRRQAKTAKTRERGSETDAAATTKVRFSAKGLAAQRQRLGLSAHDVGLLVGPSGQSVYNWESGQIRPRASELPAIAALRKMGRREAGARLEALRAAK
jgi:DNA-binding transcriptional regulator YiaG